MGLGPGGFPVPIPGSTSRELEELDEVGAAVVERAGVGVRMDEEEEGCRDTGVSVATKVCVCFKTKIASIRFYIHVI